jgi:hypothetical protein
LLNVHAGGTLEGGGLTSLRLDSCTAITGTCIASLARFQGLRTLSLAFMTPLRDSDTQRLCAAFPSLQVRHFPIL